METQQKVEREVNLAELFWSILFEWRKLLCIGVIFAVLFGGMKYLLDMRSSHSEQTINVEQLEEGLSEDEMQQVLNARNMKARIEEYENYLETSVLMQIDPYKKQILELQYYVESDYTFNYTQETQNDYTNNLMNLYYNYIISGEMSSNVIKAAKLSIGQADISELWTVSQVGTSISIKITCPEEEKMEAIANSIKEQLSQKEKEFQVVGAHELKLLGESQNVVVDTVLIDRKNAISNNIAAFNTQLNTMKGNMTEQQLALLNNEQEKEENIQETTVKAGFSVKYMIVGVVFGVFLVCIWVACKMVFTSKLQNSEEIRTLYGVRLLGEIKEESKRKRFLCVVDNKLLAIKNRRKKALSVDQQIKVISANIALSCKKNDLDCIFLTGSDYENIDPKVLGMLKNELVSQGIKIKEGENIYYDAQSLKQGTEVGNIIFVEQQGKSIYDEIYNELNLAKEQRNSIIGIIVLI